MTHFLVPDNDTLVARWHETWHLLGSPPPHALLHLLVTLYAEPHRAYHNLDHIAFCLTQAASVRRYLNHLGELELALWFHDAIYDPHSGDNELQSASLASRELQKYLPPDPVVCIHQLVLATQHPARPAEPDARYMVDIDLAILGQPPAAFDQYESAIRLEYSWVAEDLYKQKRAQLLRGFLALQSIYLTSHFSRCERQARENLSRSLDKLQ